MVALGHRADLRHRLVAFVDEQKRVVGEVFEQRRRRLAGQAAGEEARVILDPRATAGGGDHLEVEVGALLEALVLEQFAFRFHFLEPLGQLVADRAHRLLQRRARRHIVRVGVDLDAVEARRLLAGQRVELDDLLDVVAEERHAPGGVFIVRRKDLQAVAAHPEIAARERLVVAPVLQRDQLADDLALVGALALLQLEGHRRVGLDRADAVQAGNRGDNDHIIALEQRPRRRVAHAVDGLVHRFLLDVGVGARHVGFGLVVIVVADEIFDGVVGEEALELPVQLGGEDLVGASTSAGRCKCSITLAMVKVLPEPVTPSSTWLFSPSAAASVSSLIAVGWSPAGS